MPVVTFNKKYLMKLLSASISDKELEDKIKKMGFEVERSDAEEISIEVTPNRPDMYGAVGFARSLKNFMHRSKKLIYEIKDQTPAFEITVGKEVSQIRPFIAGLVAYDLKLSEAALADLISFTEKLCETYGRSRKKIAIGLHDLDQMEPPLRYNAYQDETYVPLNEKQQRSFSYVLKGTEKGRKYGHTIEGSGKRYPALKDNQGVLALIPILNSERTKITAKTKNMFIDITGIYEDSVNKVADMLAALFIDLGADVKKVEVTYPGKTSITPILKERQIFLPLSIAEGEIGVTIGFNNVISLANKMGYEAGLLDKSVRFRIPEYRVDIIDEQDIIEDLAIAYGYDFIQPVSIPSTQKGELESKEVLFEKISEAMVGMGFSEMLNTYLTNEKTNFEKMRIRDVYKYFSTDNMDYVRLKNAKAQSITMMRTWLLPSLLNNIAMSAHEKMPQKLFELDMIFYLSKKTPKEDYHLAGIYTDPRSNFNNMKGIIESLAYSLSLEFKVDRYEHESFIKGRCAKITCGKEFIGIFGELHPGVLGDMGIDEPTCAFEADLTPILELLQGRSGD